MANMSLVCELVFCNDKAFINVNIEKAMMLMRTSKYACENPNIVREIAKDKAYCYLDILYNNVRESIISNRESGIENFYLGDEIIINDLMEENDMVCDMFKNFLIHDYSQFLVENYIDAWDMDPGRFSKYYKNVLDRLDLDYVTLIMSEDIVIVDFDKKKLIKEHCRLCNT
jgi:hypothetical protein